MERDRICRKCCGVIESDRPKNARYCKECGARRIKDWKREHPERVKLYDFDEQVEQWRKKRDWKEYVRRWREENHEQYREQNRRHLKDHRERKRLLFMALISLCWLASAVQASSAETDHSTSPIVAIEEFIIRATALLSIVLLCLKLIFHEVRRLLEDNKRKRKK